MSACFEENVMGKQIPIVPVGSKEFERLMRENKLGTGFEPGEAQAREVKPGEQVLDDEEDEASASR